jgi:ferric-dicitrate binding protein FerR (iron transport regulator)
VSGAKRRSQFVLIELAAVPINIPTEISFERFSQHRCAIRLVHGAVMFETVPADVSHHPLEIGYLNDGP